MNNAEKLRRMHRSRIHHRTIHRVLYAGEDRETLTCTECGLSQTQRVGGAKFRIDPALAKKLIHYRGKLSDDSDGGILAECRRCTQRKRDERYPKGWGPLGPQSGRKA